MKRTTIKGLGAASNSAAAAITMNLAGHSMIHDCNSVKQEMYVARGGFDSQDSLQCRTRESCVTKGSVAARLRQEEYAAPTD